MHSQITIPKEALERFCRHWQIAELALFGSVTRDDFSPRSDIDVMVRFLPEAKHSLFDMVNMEDALSNLFGRQVDLISQRGIERSRNPIRRSAILRSAKIIYAA